MAPEQPTKTVENAAPADPMLPAVLFKLTRMGVEPEELRAITNSQAGEEIVKFLQESRRNAAPAEPSKKDEPTDPVAAFKKNAASKGPTLTSPPTSKPVPDDPSLRMVFNTADISNFHEGMLATPDARPLMRFNTASNRWEVF